MNAYLKQIGQRVREERKKKKDGMRELGKFLGVTRQAVAKYESGERAIPLDFIYKLVHYFGVSSDYLLGVKRRDEEHLDHMFMKNQVIFLKDRLHQANVDRINYKYELEKCQKQVALFLTQPPGK